MSGKEGGPIVLDTFEIRWFVHEAIPTELVRWFTGSGKLGFMEERCDLYRVGGRTDLGLKRRGGRVLELKAIQGACESVVLGPGLSGQLEHWRKWSPVDGLEPTGSGLGDRPWTDVHKVITKRFFSRSGRELTAGSAAGPDCEAEITSVTLGYLEAWSLAFATLGPVEWALESMERAWGTITSAAPAPPALTAWPLRCESYPAWLTRVASTSPVHSG